MAEGVSNLTIEELQSALRDRGMRGSSKFRAYLEMRLNEWLDLSLNNQVPLTLLIISRTFVITETEKTEDLLKDALSSLSEGSLLSKLLVHFLIELASVPNFFSTFDSFFLNRCR